MPYSTALCLGNMSLYLLLFMLGSVIGSFLNVIIYRLPRNLNFGWSRSRCPHCSHPLRLKDLVPVLSYLGLGGHCRYCGANIARRYCLVEILGGWSAVLTVTVYGLSLIAVVSFAFIAGLILVAFIDLDTLIIPNTLVVYLAVPSLILVAVLPGVSWLEHGIGLVVVALPLTLLTGLIPNSFGGGDIKLMAVCGLGLGWSLSLLAWLLSVLLGGIYGIYLLVVKRADRKQAIAFGPFLALGLTIALLYGQNILRWYFGIIH